MNVLISFFSPPSGAMGPLTRTLALGSAAKTKDCEVVFCAPGNFKKNIEEQGFKVVSIQEPTLFGTPKFISNILVKFHRRLTLPVKSNKSFGNIWLMLFIMGLFKNSYLKANLKIHLQIINKFKPDIIFTEFEPASYISAKLSNTPMETTFSTPMLDGENSFFYNLVTKRINKIFERRFKAKIVEKSGCDFMGKINQFTKEWFREKISKHPEVKENALHIPKKT